MENDCPVGPRTARIWLAEFAPYLVQHPYGSPLYCNVTIKVIGVIWKVTLKRNVISDMAWDYFEVSRVRVGQPT